MLNLVFIYPNIIFGIEIENLIMYSNSMFYQNNKGLNSIQIQFLRNWNKDYSSVPKFYFRKPNGPSVCFDGTTNVRAQQIRLSLSRSCLALPLTGIPRTLSLPLSRALRWSGLRKTGQTQAFLSTQWTLDSTKVLHIVSLFPVFFHSVYVFTLNLDSTQVCNIVFLSL